MSRYDPILDDFEEDSEVTVSSGFKKSTGNSDGANQKSKASKNAKAEDTKEPDDEELAEVEEQESWSDDPVRMYLTQMGEIPLLTRVEEIRLAKRIEDTRRDFRAKLLESDYVFQMAFKILRRVHLGELPFDRTVQVSVTDRLEKEQIMGRMPGNLDVVETLLRQNKRDFRVAVSKSFSKSERREAWKNLGRRRRRCCLLYTSPSPRDATLSRMPSSA